jgi:hypothetical protein
MQASPPPEGQATTEAAITTSPLQARLKWLELLTNLLLLTTIGIFAFTAITALVRPTARRFLEPVSMQSTPRDHGSSEGPLDFFRDDEDEEVVPDPHSRGPSGLPRMADEDEESGGKEKVNLRAGIVKNDSKLYGKSSEQSAEMGEVRAGETVFVMQQSGDWVLVLRGEGAMMGWMRKENVSAR